MIKIFNEIYLKKRKLLILFATCLIATLAICMINSVNAVDINIDQNTPGGLKQAIQTANNGDTILLKSGVYTDENNTDLKITKNVSIKGLGSNVVIDGENYDRFLIISGKKVSLINLKFTKGFSTSNGVISHVKGDLTLTNCIFTDNVVVDAGGGVICSYDGVLSISNCIFKNNRADIGGAIKTNSKTTITNCTFTNNRATVDGGAIKSDKNVLSLDKCIFTNNRAKDGGTIYTNSKTTINSCTFNNNRAEDGGAIHSKKNALSLNKCIFTDNKAKDGGAIKTFSKTTVSSCTFTNNIVDIGCGGAISSLENSLTVENSIFTKNKASQGGAIDVQTKFTLSKCNFTSNNAYHGGAINTFYKFTVNKCNFANNKASYGGAIEASEIKITGSTFSNNQAKKEGGAIFASKYNQAGYLPTTLSIDNTKFTKNIAGKKYNAIWTPKKSKITTKNVKISPKDGTKV